MNSAGKHGYWRTLIYYLASALVQWMKTYHPENLFLFYGQTTRRRFIPKAGLELAEKIAQEDYVIQLGAPSFSLQNFQDVQVLY